MANANTNKIISVNGSKATIYYTMASDGSQETDYTLYDSSAVATAAGDSDTLDCTIEWIEAYANAASTARISLEWDASTDIQAFNIPVNTQVKNDYRNHGGLPSQAGSGKTGDINMTTTGLASGDSIVIVIGVRRN